MSLIEKLVEIRLVNFIKEHDIDVNCYGRKISWNLLKQKFIKDKLVTMIDDEFDCYLVINNIIWKNIMVSNIVDNNWRSHMHHNNFQNVILMCRSTWPYLSYNILLNKHWLHYPMLKDNCTKLETKIINYMMLIDIIITEYMISDLVYMFKMYIFDVMLIV